MAYDAPDPIDLEREDMLHLSGYGMGLNAGSETDDDEAPYQTPIMYPSISVDVEPDLSSVMAFEARIQDLCYLAADIERSGGMCQSFAMEAERICPELLNVPIGFYTKDLSATRYKVALEEIHKGIWVLIAAAAAALIAAIVKLYKYLKGDTSGSPSSPKQESIKQMAKYVEEAPKIMEKVQSEMHSAENLLRGAHVTFKDEQGNSFEVSSFQQVIDKVLINKERYGRAKEFLNSENPIINDIATNGIYSRTAMGMGSMYRNLTQLINLKMRGIHEVISHDLNNPSYSAMIANKASLISLNKPIMVMHTGHPMTLHEAATHTQNVRNSVLESKITKTVPFDVLLRSVASSFENPDMKHMLVDMEQSIPVLGAMEEMLEKLRSVARDMSTDGITGATSEGVGVLIRNIIKNVADDISGFTAMIVQTRRYVNDLRSTATEVLGFSMEIIRKVTDAMKMSKQEIPEEWTRVMNYMRIQHKAINQSFDQHFHGKS